MLRMNLIFNENETLSMKKIDSRLHVYELPPGLYEIVDVTSTSPSF